MTIFATSGWGSNCFPEGPSAPRRGNRASSGAEEGRTSLPNTDHPHYFFAMLARIFYLTELRIF